MISVIVPALNESDTINATLRSIAANESPHEVIVVDAKSDDGTAEAARTMGVRVLSCDVRQRAAQMNLGARESSGKILLFLHADTLLPAGALERVEQTLKEPETVGGAFFRKFASHSRFLRFTCSLSAVRNRTIGWHLGDQAMFCREETFAELGGFKVMPRFEDLDFSRRLKGRGKVVTLAPPVVSSARRFHRLGPWKTTWRDLWLTMRYASGKERELVLGEQP